jgi:chromosome segregation ATPase
MGIAIGGVTRMASGSGDQLATANAQLEALNREKETVDERLAVALADAKNAKQRMQKALVDFEAAKQQLIECERKLN